MFNLYFLLRCLTVIGILLMFDRKQFILELVENFPCLIRFMVSCTVLLSGSIIIGSFDSLSILYSASMAVARLKASISQQLHFLVWSLSLAEWYRTGTSDFSFTAKSVCPIPGLLLAPSGFITN